jgi:hypothetical protein
VNALLKLLKSPQVGRIIRLLGFTIASALVAVPLVQQAELRYPLLGVIVGVLEAVYRTAVPTQPAPFATAVLADPPTKPGPPA